MPSSARKKKEGKHTAEETQGSGGGDQGHHQPGEHGRDKQHIRHEAENPRSMFRDDHVLDEKFGEIEVRLPNTRPAPVLQFGFPVFDAAAHERFFFKHPAPTEVYTLSLHDALPI